jgi:zinc resistance-associated protein
MKRVLTAAGIITMVAALAVPVLAQGPGMGRGRMMQGYGPGSTGDQPRYGSWAEKLTDEQKAQLDKLHQKFFDDTAQLRSQIAAKHSELNILMNTSNPDVQKARSLQKDLSDLKAKMAQERINLQFEVRKINPDARFGMGFGRGMGGPGRGMGGFGLGMGGDGPGMGWHRGGFGQGHCWN